MVVFFHSERALTKSQRISTSDIITSCTQRRSASNSSVVLVDLTRSGRLISTRTFEMLRVIKRSSFRAASSANIPDHWQHPVHRISARGNDAWPDVRKQGRVDRRAYDHVASDAERFGNGEELRSRPGVTGTANHIIAKTVECIRQQIAIAASAD